VSSWAQILFELSETVALVPSRNAIILAMALLVAGGLVGLLAGLFGIGGGTVIVPLLYEMFGWLSVPEDIRMPLCIGTSLAVIIPTSLSAFETHWKRGAVDVAILKFWILPLIVGVLVGIATAQYAPVAVFKIVFIVIALITAARLVWSKAFPVLAATPPHGAKMISYGVAIGASSSLAGIGGGLLANMLLTMHGTSLQRAIATSSGIGIVVSIPGTLGYAIAGWHHAGLPPLSLGFVSLMGLFLLIPTSLITARAGAALAHTLPKLVLERMFAAYLVVVSLRFALSLGGA
jgi:uncharacterized membrane protein YfcA